MDYQSFQPGGQNLNQAPSLSPQQLMAPKTFTPKFIGVVLILIALGMAVSYAIWYWGNQQVAQEVAPTFTPRALATVNPTAGWKIYTNTQYGFEVKIPAGWSAELSSASSNGQVIYFMSAETKAAQEENLKNCADPLIKHCISEGPFSEIVFSNQSTLALDIQQYHPNVMTKTYNGVEFKIHPIYGMIDGTTYETQRNGQNYVFDVYDAARINQILSTFKFTK